jgi:hypothetical protein
VPADDGAFVPLARLLRAEQPREDAPPPPAVVPEPAPVRDLSERARDLRLMRARLADAFDAGLAGEVDALLAALLEELQ